MTCVLQSPWQFSQFRGWSSMDSASSVPVSQEEVNQQQYGRAASESESTQGSNDSNKKRMSRAGTRSVSTLSAAQLERKRANDRDAQRAIRLRTKEHIDNLERTIKDLRVAQEAAEKLLAATQQQNRDVLAENAYLRSKLGEAGVPIMLPESASRLQHIQSSLQPAAPAHASTIPASIPENAPSTPRSVASLANSQTSEPHAGYWHPPQLHTVQSAPANLQTPTPLRIVPNLASWRPQDGSQGVEPSPSGFPNQVQSSPYPSYYSATSNAGNPWPTQPQNHMLLAQRLEQPDAQITASNYSSQHSPLSHPPQMQASVQPIIYDRTVASPVMYHNQQQPAFGQPVQYVASPAQVSPVVIKHEMGEQPATTHLDLAYDRQLHNQPPNQATPTYSRALERPAPLYAHPVAQPIAAYDESIEQSTPIYNQSANQPIPPYAGPSGQPYLPQQFPDR